MNGRQPAAAAPVWIAGRPFELGAVYLPPPSERIVSAVRARRLVGYQPDYPWPGGRVEVEVVERRGDGRKPKRTDMSGRKWVAWATADDENEGRTTR
jgi:hypothetical protein